MRVALLGVLAVSVCLFNAAVGVHEESGENEERLIEATSEDSLYDELSDQADVAESEESLGEHLDDTPVTAEDDEQLEDIQEEGTFDSQSLIMTNQCGSYAKKFADGIKSLSSYMSEIAVNCGNCTSIALKGIINANIEFCTGAGATTPCLKSSSLVLPQCGKLFRVATRIRSIPFELPVGNTLVKGRLNFNLPYAGLPKRACYSVKVVAARAPSRMKYGRYFNYIRRSRFPTC